LVIPAIKPDFNPLEVVVTFINGQSETYKPKKKLKGLYKGLTVKEEEILAAKNLIIEDDPVKSSLHSDHGARRC